GDMAHDWGAYYDCNPSVYAGYVPAGYEALGKVAAAHRLLENIWQDALSAGQNARVMLRQP
ncbi:hypothetical protein, partial [Thiolapillus sp.]